jgi:hypothetical protein
MDPNQLHIQNLEIAPKVTEEEEEKEEKEQDEEEANNLEVNLDIARIQQEIAELDTRDAWLTKVLMDVVTDVSSPENSDNEDTEDNSNANNSEDEVINTLMSVDPVPRDESGYSDLYQSEDYKKRVNRKVNKMKRLIKRTAGVHQVMNEERFRQEEGRIRRVYPEVAGRKDLYQLVAFYCTVNYEN